MQADALPAYAVHGPENTLAWPEPGRVCFLGSADERRCVPLPAG